MGKKYWRFNVGDGLPDWVKEGNKWVWKNLAPREPGDGGEMNDVKATKQVVQLAKNYIELEGEQKMIAECSVALDK